jgi:diguanylate cyclase (GGDEF)-like protein
MALVIRGKRVWQGVREWFLADPLVTRIAARGREYAQKSKLCAAVRAAEAWYEATPMAQEIAKHTTLLFAIVVADVIFKLPPAGRMVYVLPVFGLTRTAGLHTGVAMAAAAAIIGTEMDRMAGFHDTWLLNGIIRFLLLVVVAFKVDSMVDRLKETADTAIHDALTGVLNRLGFDRAAEEVLETAIAEGTTLVVAQIDMDDFKLINDMFGHAFGDRVLKVLVECLKPAVAEGGVLGRAGGDEFQIVFPDTHKVVVEKAVQRALNRFTDATLVLGHRASFSVGLATLREDGASLESLFSAADRAMYRRKLLKARPSMAVIAASERITR